MAYSNKQVHYFNNNNLIRTHLYGEDADIFEEGECLIFSGFRMVDNKCYYSNDIIKIKNISITLKELENPITNQSKNI